MTKYFIYESLVSHRVRIHKADCAYCNDGAGFRLNSSVLNGRWHGPYATREDAFRAAKALDRKDTEPCAACLP